MNKMEICNLALMRLGAMPILSMDQQCKAAIALKANFDLILLIVLRDHPWNFAEKRASLAQLSEAPLFGYDYAYQLPVDRVRVLGLVGGEDKLDPTLDFKIEGDQLLTNQTSAKIQYIYKVTDPAKFDAKFSSALASRLAAEIAYHLTGAAAMKKQMMAEYLQELADARSIDAQENPPEIYSTNDWMDARI